MADLKHISLIQRGNSFTIPPKSQTWTLSVIFHTRKGFIKEIFWYDSTHAGLQETGQEDRLSWLARQLGFKYP